MRTVVFLFLATTALTAAPAAALNRWQDACDAGLAITVTPFQVVVAVMQD